MNRAVSILIPAALFVAWVWVIVQGIDSMAAQERGNRFHAMLLNCKYMAKSKEIDALLYFDCDGNIELHKEIQWNTASIK